MNKQESYKRHFLGSREKRKDHYRQGALVLRPAVSVGLHSLKPQTWFPQFRIKILVSVELLTSSYWCLMEGQKRFLRHPPTRPTVELKYVYIYACVYFK